MALTAVGLDPGRAMVRSDKKLGDSMSIDFLEVIRPAVETWTLEPRG